MVHQLTKEFTETLDKHRESLRAATEAGDKAGEAVSLYQIGSIYEEQGLWSLAWESYARAFKLYMACNRESPDIQLVVASIERLHDQMLKAGRHLPDGLAELVSRIRAHPGT